jgi:hypothetical protein
MKRQRNKTDGPLPAVEKSSDRPLVPSVLSTYRNVSPTDVPCKICNGTVYFGKGRSDDPTLPPTIYACHCTYFNAKQIGHPTESQWQHEVERFLALTPAKSAAIANTNSPTCKSQKSDQPELLFLEEADKVKKIHQQLLGMGKTMIERMIEAGEILTRVKRGLPHGAWMPWVQMHIAELSHRTINRYMRTYQRRNDPLLEDDPVRFIAEISGNVDKLESPELSDPAVSANSELQPNSTSTSNLDTDSETD